MPSTRLQPAAPRARMLALAFAAACSSGSGGNGGTTGPPGSVPVATVTVSPATANLQVGDTLRLSATTRDSAGGVLTGRAVTWSSASASLATVSASGLVTAVANGSVTITATSEGRQGSAVLTLSDPPPPPANNECATPGTGWIWCDDFESNRFASYFEVDTAGGKFVRTGGVGFNNSMGMRVRFSAGDVDVGSLHLAIGLTPQAYIRAAVPSSTKYREVYWRVYLRNQPGWTGGGGHKLSRAFVFGSSTSFAQAMIAHVWGGSAPNQNYLYIDPARGTDAAGNLVTTSYNDFANLTFLGAVRGVTQVFTGAAIGQWHCVEARARLNDAGLSNGVQELWVDGALEASRTDLNFLGSFSAYGINAVYLENYWNAPGAPAQQERYLDRFVVSTQRIGC